jgi:hypothetical protein
VKWINIIVFTILVILGFAFIYDYETVDSYFEGYGEASRDGMLSSGWIPQILPKSAKNINERRNIDTNETWVSSNFDPVDSARLNGCETPVIKYSSGRFGFKLISAASARGDMHFDVIEGAMDADKFIAFLLKLRGDTGCPILVIADSARYHRASKVRALLEIQ